MTPGAPSIPHRWLSILRIIHPFPTLLNTFVAGGLGLIATGGHVAPLRLAHLMLAMLAIQACIGTVNDLTDRGLDTSSKPGKPLVDGSLSIQTAQKLAAASFAAAVSLSTGFGLAAWLLAIAGLGCGLAYDLWLKRTPASGIPYVIALPLLPLWVWAAVGQFRLGLLALIPLGCLLGLALHLANSLADFESDEQEGVRGLVHLLGRGRAIALCWGSFALVLLVVGASSTALRYNRTLLLPGLAAGALMLAGAVLFYAWRPDRRSLQAGWGLLAAGSAALALSWLAALPPR